MIHKVPSEYYELFYQYDNGYKIAVLYAERSLRLSKNKYDYIIPYNWRGLWGSDFRQMVEWIKSEIQGEYFRPMDLERNMYDGYYKIRYTYIALQNSEDALAFKLRWS